MKIIVAVLKPTHNTTIMLQESPLINGSENTGDFFLVRM